MASKFFLKPFVTLPVAPVITGIILHFRFHIRCISVLKLLYLSCVPYVLHNIPICRYCHIYQYTCFLGFFFFCF
jgi:hypothetical protein